jgi:hypothetical protein
MQTYKVPPIRRPKKMRVRKNGRTGRMEMVVDYDGFEVVLTHEEVKAEAARQRAGRGLRG